MERKLLLFLSSHPEFLEACSFHHLGLSNTSPAALSSRPCTKLASLDIKGATSHSGPLITPRRLLLWAVASGVAPCH